VCKRQQTAEAQQRRGLTGFFAQKFFCKIFMIQIPQAGAVQRRFRLGSASVCVLSIRLWGVVKRTQKRPNDVGLMILRLLWGVLWRLVT
jgi:hypothetical protein